MSAVPLPSPQFLENSFSNGTFACSDSGSLWFVTLAQVGDAPLDNHNLCIWRSSDAGANPTKGCAQGCAGGLGAATNEGVGDAVEGAALAAHDGILVTAAQ